MSKVKIGLLTIGQSPRDDFVPEIKPLLLPQIEFVEFGLLDELSSEEIKSLEPDTGEMPFHYLKFLIDEILEAKTLGVLVPAL